MQEIRSTISTSLLPEGNAAVPSRYVGRSALLDILYGYKGGKPNITSRNKVKRKTIAAVGTHVVEIEGPVTSLRDGVDKNCLLVPLYLNSSLDKESDSHVERYVYLPRNKYNSMVSTHPIETLNMNDMLTHLSDKVIDLRKYDLDKYPNGLLFLYRPNNSLRNQTIVKEWDTTEVLEHWQFNGTVMSHWIHNPNVYSIKQSHVDVMESVFGHKGFSRSSVDSIGINIYTGTKSSPRVIPNPL
jgi:hypothetical protein